MSDDSTQPIDKLWQDQCAQSYAFERQQWVNTLSSANYVTAPEPSYTTRRAVVLRHILKVPVSSYERSFAQRHQNEHEKLAMNAWRSRRWVLNNHPEDQFPNFLRCLSSPCGPPDVPRHRRINRNMARSYNRTVAELRLRH